MLNSPSCLNPITFDQCDLPSRSFCICIEFLLVFALHICAFPQRWFSNPPDFLPQFFRNSQRWGAGSVIYANSPLPYSSATLFCYDNADTSSACEMKYANIKMSKTQILQDAWIQILIDQEGMMFCCDNVDTISVQDDMYGTNSSTLW